MTSLVVRPSSSLMSIPAQQLDPLAIGKKLLVRFVLAGNFFRSESGFDLNWQLLDVPSQSVRAGGSINVASFDLISVQTEICNEVFSTLQGFGDLANAATAADSARDDDAASLSPDVSEEYLQARAVLSSFMSRTGSLDDLNRARVLFESVTAQHADYAPAWSGLGITHLQYARHGLGGQIHRAGGPPRLRQGARTRSRLGRGQSLPRLHAALPRRKRVRPPRHRAVAAAPPPTTGTSISSPASLCVSTACTTRRSTSSTPPCASTRTTPPSSTTTARACINIRTSSSSPARRSKKASRWSRASRCCASRSAISRCASAISPAPCRRSKSVISDEASLRIVFPTIALCYVQLGDRAKAATFILDETLSAAEADGEMAYRLATYFAVDGDESEALHWLRRAIYLGNENYPWFSRNPAWKHLTGHSDFERILEDLKKSYRRNQKNWKRLLAQASD